MVTPIPEATIVLIASTELVLNTMFGRYGRSLPIALREIPGPIDCQGNVRHLRDVLDANGVRTK